MQKSYIVIKAMLHRSYLKREGNTKLLLKDKWKDKQFTNEIKSGMVKKLIAKGWFPPKIEASEKSKTMTENKNCQSIWTKFRGKEITNDS